MLVNDPTIIAGFTSMCAAVTALYLHQRASNLQCIADRTMMLKVLLDLTGARLSTEKMGAACAKNANLECCPVNAVLQADHDMIAFKLADLLKRGKPPRKTAKG